jgi:hypothetical protein
MEERWRCVVVEVPLLCLKNRVYIYLGLGSYRLTIKERNCGVVSRGKSR